MSYQLPGTGNSHSLGNVFENNSTYTVQSDDYAVICTNSAIIIITLPAPASYPNRLLVIMRAPASIAQVDVQGTVNGVIGTYSLTNPGDVFQLASDGVTWWVIN